jgi:hypothetical protein
MILVRIHLITYDKEDFYKGLGWKEIQRTEHRSDKVTVMALGWCRSSSPSMPPIAGSH